MTRWAFAWSASVSSSMSTFGTICHDTPNLSFSQPHGPSSPPSESVLQSRSTSSWLSQLTSKEIASLNVKSGPPFKAVNVWPSSSKLTVITIPSARGPAEP
jgi:hypothetical protein